MTTVTIIMTDRPDGGVDVRTQVDHEDMASSAYKMAAFALHVVDESLKRYSDGETELFEEGEA